GVVWKGEFSDPPAWPGWQYRRQWVAAVRRWNKASDIPTERRAEKVLRTLGWEMQVEFEHLSEAQLASPQYLDHILQIIEMKAGVREDDDKRAAFKSVLHDNGRRKDESLSQYVSRRVRDFTKAATYGVQLPEEFRAALLREGAGLNDQGLQNLTALLQGDDNRVDRVAQVLARMDTRQDRITGFVHSPEEHRTSDQASWMAMDTGNPEDLIDEPSGDDGDETDEDCRVLAELTDLSFSEEQAALVFAIVENRMPRPRRTWKENKRFKQELRKDRRSFVKGPPDDRPHDRTGEGHGGTGRPRLSKEQLKKISKCRLCGRRGHWAEDCRSRGTPRPEAGAKLSNFCYLGGSLSGATNGFTGVVFSQEVAATGIEYGESKVTFDPTRCFLTIPSGMAILDIGATQDIIGTEAFAALERELGRCGLQAVEIPTTARAPTGIGGAAKVAHTMLVPISPGGVPGVIQFLVIEQNIPPLLSVGLLEHLGTAMDLTTNMVNFQTIGVDMKMVNLPSGHRAVPLVEWPGGDFPVPQVVKNQHGLSDGAFAKTLSASSAYMKKSEVRTCRVPDNVGASSEDGSSLMPAMSQQQFMSHTSDDHVSVQSPRWAISLLRVVPNSNVLPLAVNMELPSRATAASATPYEGHAEKSGRITQLWRSIVVKMFYLLENIRARFARLAAAEIQQKSLLSERHHYLLMDAQKPAACLHPGQPIRRANQYATWTVCPKCSARLTYVSKHIQPKGKAKARARAGGYQVPPDPAEAVAQARTRTTRSSGSMELPPTEPVHPELASTLRAMMTSFREVGESLRELARGQGQMLTMMHGQFPSTIESMSLAQAAQAAENTVDQEMGLEPESPEGESQASWAPVDNPNAADLPQCLLKGWGHSEGAWVLHHSFGTSVPRGKLVGSRGPGPAPPEVPKDSVSVENIPVGFNEDGEHCQTGSDIELEDKPDLEVDVINLFETMLPNAIAQAAGLRVSAAHEDFTRQGEWSSGRKEHRQRFRHFIRHRRPEVLLASVPQASDGHEVLVRHRVDVTFALEAIKTQVESGRHFYIEVNHDDEFWTSAEWVALVDHGGIRVGGSEDRRRRCATNMNIPLKAAILMPETSVTRGSQECLYESAKSGDHRLARSREQANLRTDPRSLSGPRPVLLWTFRWHHLGTYKLKFTTLYLNDFLTAQGASGPRSSISITQNAAVRPHRDAHNVNLNYCIALGKFKGGDLWVESPEGTIFKKLKSGVSVAGKVVKHQGRLNVFDPKKYHAVEEYEGERWSITAFTTRSSQSLSSGQRDHLESFGFSLQGYEGAPILPSKTAQDCCAVTTASTGATGSGYSFATTSADEILGPSRGEDTDSEDEESEARPEASDTTEAKLTESQKRLVRKLHENTGHPPKERFLRTLRAAGALPHVLKYIRDVFECETCAAKRLPDHRRKGQCPRVHSFNRVLSVDVFYVPVKGSSIPILNVVCHGTNYQVAHRIHGTGGGTPSSSATWKAFLSTWVRFLGPPSMVITDGGKEFQGRFERGVEQLGTLHHVTAPDSPWQNSRAERHGGWLKQRMIQELESGQSVIENLDDLDEILAATTAAKNRWFCSGGYTPVQLVFGEMPRVPGELLSDNPSGLQPLCDAFNDPAGNLPWLRRVEKPSREPPDEVVAVCPGAASTRLPIGSSRQTTGIRPRARRARQKKETTWRQSTSFLQENRTASTSASWTSRTTPRIEEPGSSSDPVRAPGTPIQELLETLRRGGDLQWNLVASRSDEVDIRKMSKEDRALFDQSDEVEWKAILQTGAVRVVYGEEAAKLRRQYPDHTAELVTFAPTPSSEGLMAFLQVSLNLSHTFAFCDVKNAFCQSDKLVRKSGPLFAQPCEGLRLGTDALIIIDVPVYGLDDAPAAWRATVVSFLEREGFVRNLVEPCWWSRFDRHGTNEAQVLIEVDDFIVTALPELQSKLKEAFQARFTFGKWEENEAEYAGRMIKVRPGFIHVDQEKYLTEQVNWVAKETRPEVAGMASILASKLKSAVIEDVLVLNKNINFLRNTASRPLTIWKMDTREMAFVVISDAGGVGAKHDTTDELDLPADSTQGAWMVFAAEALPIGNMKVKASPLAWRSSKLRRKVFSTFGGETQAMLQGISQADWLQIMVRDAVQHDVELKQWRNWLSPHMIIMKGDLHVPERQPQCSVTDAKSLYDCIMKEHPQGKQDRRSALELAIIVRDLQETRSMVRWVPHQKMVVDVLTKVDPLKANGAMDQFLRSGQLSLVDVDAEIAARASDPRNKSRSHSAS
ncbi:unnamed protein product, partial [Symbiodinium necroappetens]